MKAGKIGILISAVMLVAAMVVMGVGVYKMSDTVEELAVERTKGQAEAILASANIKDDAVVTVPVLYYDQKTDECTGLYSASTRAAASSRQFEWSKCGYQNFAIEKEIVEGELSNEYLPVAVGGEAVVNRGVAGERFARWFTEVPGESKSYGSTLTLKYDADAASFKYENNRFYPLDGLVAFDDAAVNYDGHNHLFTMNLGLPIQVLANGSEKFEITADDDTWVFVDDKLVLDAGGIHDAVKGVFEIRSSGEVYAGVRNESLAYAGVMVSEKDTVVIRVFHADRDSGTESVLKLALINMVPNITETRLAAAPGTSSGASADGVEIAYDPNNPSYVAPLGESLTVRPNRSRALTTAVAVQGVVIGACAIIVVVAATFGVRAWRRSR